ncbi:MAG: universal stress protein [Desulfobacterales bacterium]
MQRQLLHIFRNTPLGRETFLSSLYFCSRIGAVPVVYVPTHTKFLMYFDNDVVQVDLDESYLTDPGSARGHVEDLAAGFGLEVRYVEPEHFTASTLPDISTDYDFMCLPRTVSDFSSKIGLGYIGPRVRRIVNSARFPVLITSANFKPWQSIAVMFGGSVNARKALRIGIRLSDRSGLPLRVFTQSESLRKEDYLEGLEEMFSQEEIGKIQDGWRIFDGGEMELNLYEIPHDALVVLGAYGHGLIRDIVFGSKMERIQSTLPNNLLVVGPNHVVPV